MTFDGGLTWAPRDLDHARQLNRRRGAPFRLAMKSPAVSAARAAGRTVRRARARSTPPCRTRPPSGRGSRPWTASRPRSVISAQPAAAVLRDSGLRITMPCASSRSIVFVTLVGCTMSRSPITRSGSAPSRLNDSSTSASYLANVSPCGRRIASSSPSRICWARMIEVTAAIADDGPNLRSQIRAARSIGIEGQFKRFPHTGHPTHQQHGQGPGVRPGRGIGDRIGLSSGGYHVMDTSSQIASFRLIAPR